LLGFGGVDHLAREAHVHRLGLADPPREALGSAAPYSHRNMLFGVCCMLFAACCMVFAACCILVAACCMVFAACCMVFAACCILFAAGCISHVVPCWDPPRPTHTTAQPVVRPPRQVARVHPGSARTPVAGGRKGRTCYCATDRVRTCARTPTSVCRSAVGASWAVRRTPWPRAARDVTAG
jgi:hypothetical protein